MNAWTHALVRKGTVSQARVGLSATRPVRAQPMSVVADVAPHDHEYYEICVVRRGSARHLTESEERRVAKGSVVVIPPPRVHAFRGVTDLHVTNVYYLGEWLLADLPQLWGHDALVPLFLATDLFPRAVAARARQFGLDVDEFDAAMDELGDLVREWNASQPSVAYLKSCLLKLLIGLSRSYVRQQGRETGCRFRPEVWLALQAVEDAIAESRPFSVATVAAKSDSSRDRFARLFKEQTGWSPLDYFQMRRVHHACNLLLNSGHSITEVAHQLGYADAAHFCRLFKRHRGMSPREYRRTYLQQDPPDTGR